MRGRRPRWV